MCSQGLHATPSNKKISKSKKGGEVAALPQASSTPQLPASSAPSRMLMGPPPPPDVRPPLTGLLSSSQPESYVQSTDSSAGTEEIRTASGVSDPSMTAESFAEQFQRFKERAVLVGCRSYGWGSRGYAWAGRMQRLRVTWLSAADALVTLCVVFVQILGRPSALVTFVCCCRPG